MQGYSVQKNSVHDSVDGDRTVNGPTNQRRQERLKPEDLEDWRIGGDERGAM